MIDSILGFEFNSTLGVILYWIPLSFCVYGYSVRSFVNYQADVIGIRKKELGEHSHYAQQETIGSLIGRGLVTFIPVVNIWGAIFDLAPETFGRFINLMSRVFNQPLVREKKIRSSDMDID